MKSLQLQWFFINSLLFCSIQGKKVCDLADVECTSKASRHTYKNILAAFKDVSPDPMHLEQIETKIGESKYKLTDITLVGMKDCEVQKLLCRPKELTFDFFLYCPKLVLNANFEADGPIGALPIEGKGVTRITADKYLIICKGKYEKHIFEENQKPYVVISNYELDFEPKGKFTFELIELIEGDKAKFDEVTRFMNENWREMEKVYRKPIIGIIYTRFFDEYAKALQSIPTEDVLPVLES